LGDLIFDRPNQLQIEKFELGWKVDSKKFPTSYLEPDSDTGKASKSLLQKRDPLGGAQPVENPSAVQNFNWRDPLGGARPVEL